MQGIVHTELMNAKLGLPRSIDASTHAEIFSGPTPQGALVDVFTCPFVHTQSVSPIANALKAPRDIDASLLTLMSRQTFINI